MTASFSCHSSQGRLRKDAQSVIATQKTLEQSVIILHLLCKIYVVFHLVIAPLLTKCILPGEKAINESKQDDRDS
ncbi:hypothetical protein DUNSADRAFT_7869 [Dunaliella salina]|uniref:Encoded protein n=1 Tax=Dunaliella salina TaxID=3046 RepID=A0ABQ7GKI6_DUNSA|nr:hypothetical protein DUNSADRAFT_7869 [Dunaliella salina]|eukprot:KAF5835109.1 hypothetical protein DUNSADRAFT_7869 [Dunaliella salina]